MASGPVATVYVRNLEERIKPAPLQEALTAVFSEYGRVVEIVAKTNVKAKGQAFVVLDRPEAAQLAADELQGFEIFGRPMHTAVARTRSDATVARGGSDEELELHKRRRLAEKDKKKAAEAAEEQKRLKRPGAAAVAGGEAGRPAKVARGGAAAAGAAAGGKTSTGGAPAAAAANTVVPDEYLPPNKILFVQNLPDDQDVDALTAVFGRFEGFREVRLVPGRKGIAFIEYEAEAGAITAKENTAGMALGGDGSAAGGAKFIKVTYQRQ
ncbi:RNA recognition domain-containing protein [Xylariaceae sp. FL0804]|nr:RNA recognition domain-containing protein [Xylariaceae sp. FL0804]